MSNTYFLAGLTFEYVLNWLYPVSILLYDCYLSHCTNMMIMSHCGISVVIKGHIKRVNLIFVVL